MVQIAGTPVRVTKSGTKLTRQAVLDAEQELAVKLPDDYREFLLQANGGVPNRYRFSWRDGRGRPRYSWVQYFCTLSSSKAVRCVAAMRDPNIDDYLQPKFLRATNALTRRQEESIYWLTKRWQEHFPVGAIVIGSSAGFTLLLLLTKGRHRGSVWLVDMEHDRLNPADPHDPKSGFAKIATSFRKFLLSLTSEKLETE
jgi:SMI1 / KNR4 family (SUKH-1)